MAVKRIARLKKLKSYALPAGMLLAGCAALATGLLPLPAFQELAARTVPVLAFAASSGERSGGTVVCRPLSG